MTEKKNRKRKIFDELYTCNVCQDCIFSCQTSCFHISESVLKNHIETHHQISESIDSATAWADNSQSMKDWLNSSVDNASFEKILLDWIVNDCQIFTVTKSWWFKQMMWAEEITKQISDDDAVENKIKNCIKNVKQKINKKLATTASTVVMLFNEWISQNSLFMIIMNVIWLDDHFKQHQVCIEFVEINNSHSEENLVFIVYSILMKFNICQKLLTIITDNAENNDIFCHTLHVLLKYKFDDHLKEFLFHENLMWFKNKDNWIQYFDHIINFIVSAILEAFDSNTYKQVTEYLDQAAAQWYSKFQLSLVTSVIAQFWIIIFWIIWSSQQIQKWNKKTKKTVNYDINIQ